MRLAASKKIHYDSGPNMTPLVDVALVILIFMMLAGAFGTGEHYLTGQLPTPSPGASASLNEPVVVRLNPTGTTGLSAAFLDRHTDSLAALARQMRQLHSRLNAAAAGSADQTLILLAPDLQLPYQQVIAAYQAIAKAGFSKIAFTSAR